MEMRGPCWRATVGVALVGGLALSLTACRPNPDPPLISTTTTTSICFSCVVGTTTTTTTGVNYINEYNLAFASLNDLAASGTLNDATDAQVAEALQTAVSDLLQDSWPSNATTDVQNLINALNQTISDANAGNDISTDVQTVQADQQAVANDIGATLNPISGAPSGS
jgi:hypothetical protein